MATETAPSPTTGKAGDFDYDLAVIGGGVIGIGMPAIFLNAGAAVTIIEMLPDILMTGDKDVRDEMNRQLKKRRAKVMVNTSVEGLSVADALGIEKNGPFTQVDSRFETSLPGAYAIGDLSGGMMLACKASGEADAVVENITGGLSC